jgi:energy-coupling factor transporter ATP-binding protein EcfA2
MQRIAHDLRDRFRVKATSVHLPIRSLSGGNQQKVAIAAAIVRRPEVLVLEEPTRGVDIGSKREIYRLMREYAAAGHAVLIFCTEVPEAFEAADLVYVVSDGHLSAPLLVLNHPDVESLAKAITRLERHSAAPAAPAACSRRRTRSPRAARAARPSRRRACWWATSCGATGCRRARSWPPRGTR